MSVWKEELGFPGVRSSLAQLWNKIYTPHRGLWVRAGEASAPSQTSSPSVLLLCLWASPTLVFPFLRSASSWPLLAVVLCVLPAWNTPHVPGSLIFQLSALPLQRSLPNHMPK